MPDKITFYAVVDDERTIDNPYGLLRRLQFDDGGFTDEGLRKDFSWNFTPLIAEWEHGSFSDELIEVSHAQAGKIIEYFRSRWGRLGSGWIRERGEVVGTSLDSGGTARLTGGGAMCWMCEHPGSTPSDYLDHVRDVIDRLGWAVQGIAEDGGLPPWAYTIGLTTLGYPELVVTGLPLTRTGQVLNTMAEHVVHTGVPAPGERLRLADGPLVQTLEVAAPDELLHVAVELLGPPLQALQVVHADQEGHWPWERGYTPCAGGQPLLGRPVLRAATLSNGAARAVAGAVR